MAKKMFTTHVIVFCITLIAALPLSQAQSITAEKVLTEIKELLEPEETMVRDIHVNIKFQNDTTMEWEACEIRKTIDDEKKILIMIREPEPLYGFTILIREPLKQRAINTWVYAPSLNRIRRINNIFTYEPFLGTDFTYTDIGFIDPWADHELMPDHDEKKEDIVVLKSIPRSSAYYSKIITFVSADNFMPVKRYYYDIGGDLWKTLVFSDAKMDPDGNVISFTMEMFDHFEKTSTEWVAKRSEVKDDISNAYFTPEKLPEVKNAPFCR
ncbi:MAG: outer membrane lipoprotein-sorting protein [Desulfobacterales bacterium]